MNISKLVSGAIKAMPKTLTAKQLISGTVLFGAGMLAGSLLNCGGNEKKIGDNFERQDSIEQTVDSVKVKQPVDTVPVPTADNYDKVVIGKNGIESADTIYYAGTDKISDIYFYEDKDKKNLRHVANFDENGKLKEYTWYDPDSKNANGIYTSFNVYNAKDKRVQYTGTLANGGYRVYTVNKDEYDEFNKKGEIKHIHSRYADWYYEADGSSKEYGHDNWLGNYIEYKDKNGRLLKKKVLDGDDVLQYTVVPKYDKEGTLIKNDTIKNQQK